MLPQNVLLLFLPFLQDTLLDELRQIVEKDPLEDLQEHEKEKLWKARQDCREHIPHSLPRLLNCVQWDNSGSVSQVSRYIAMEGAA